MNGHLQLSISLNDHDAIKHAVGFLLGLLDKDETKEIVVNRSQLISTEHRPTFEEWSNTTRAVIPSEGDIVKMDIECAKESPSNYGKKGMKEMLPESVKAIDKHLQGIKDKTVTVRTVKRDKYGRFIKNEKKRKSSKV